jgi:hypothetical protein
MITSKRLMRITLLFMIFILTVSNTAILAAQGGNPQAQVSVITCDPGEELYSIYGHNAIRLKFNNGRDLVFNYGTFDFDTPNFAIKFMRGKLPYRLSVSDYNSFLAEYNYFKRGVKEQVLLLDSIQTEAVIAYLSDNLKPENIEYKYDFFFDNCATRINDVISAALKNQVVWNIDHRSHKTFRTIIKEYQHIMPWTDFGIDLIIGARADQITTLSQETFIPDYLYHHLSKARIDQNPIVKEESPLLDFGQKRIQQGTRWINAVSICFLLLLLAEIVLFTNAKKYEGSVWLKRYDLSCYIILTLAGSLMAFMWWGTDHIATKDNWNLLWAMPVWVFWAFTWEHRHVKTINYIVTGILLISAIHAITGKILPQYFHPAVAWISIAMMLKINRSN